MLRRQLQEKMGQSQQFAIFCFSHRCHEQQHHAPNAILAQLKFSPRMSVFSRPCGTRFFQTISGIEMPGYFRLFLRNRTPAQKLRGIPPLLSTFEH
jgi:hypothetical protein